MAKDPLVPVGELRERWALQSCTVTKSNGKAIESWTTYKTVWAASVEVAAAEATIGLQLQERATHILTIHYRADVRAHHRATRDGRTLNIIGVINPDGVRGRLLLACVEIKST
jgi:SPP1 family predicted phage head-tail adaptor